MEGSARFLFEGEGEMGEPRVLNKLNGDSHDSKGITQMYEYYLQIMLLGGESRRPPRGRSKALVFLGQSPNWIRAQN